MKRHEIYVSINGTRHRLDEHLNFIGYDRGVRIATAAMAEYSSDYMKYSAMVAAYIGLTSLDLYAAKATEEQLKPIYEGCMKINNVELPGLFPIISVNGKFFELINLDKMTVEQYTEIDSLLTDVENRVTVAALIAVDIYKPIKRHVSKGVQLFRERKLSTLKNVKFGGYASVSKSKRGSFILDATDLSTGYLLSILNYYLNFRALLQEEFEPIFEQRENKVKPKFMDGKQAIEAWGWYAVIDSLCEGKKQDIDYWMQQPIRELLKKLVYLKTTKK